ncbi:AraC family transcriptional regulator [Paenibacillus oryzisoli]|uniref:helix-turn-helix domain-containing protein n=1 Tax=Paenibacillus oryzisoli TaxID=1850517 RepID=UPI003D2E42E4
MQPFRKSFFSDPLFPFELVFRDQKQPLQELPEHLHDRYELVYVYEGQGTFLLNQMFYDMNEGDLFIIPGNTIHRAGPDENKPITSTAVFFMPQLLGVPLISETYSYLFAFEQAHKKMNYKLPIPPSHRAAIVNQLNQMQEELTRQESGYRHAVCLHLNMLLLQVNRILMNAIAIEPQAMPAGPAWVLDALHDLHEHHTAPGISLAYLADRACVSPAHLSRVFKQMTGMSVTDYINARRIATAKELLLATDESVDAISKRCGYESLPHFHRLFKRFTGATPGVYRRQQQTTGTPSL